ncbi:hypothetical protein MKW94_019412 [Papaver nudicaule]|uniref:Protein kinase domain-containing protein n=1 Tax=Papaver nudicaule TaxID=74823 RepID=A0AA41VDB6_PAPNU|nr:hypothetical protein [Papaver nudicaule]
MYPMFIKLVLLFLVFKQSLSYQLDGVIVTLGDHEALQGIKNELIDPYGYLKSWNDSNSGACSGEWVGIKCAQGQVIVIQLPWKGLSGRLSEKIGQLSALRKINFHDNEITGMIPSSIGFLTNLRGVHLFNNKFSGSIPVSIGNSHLLQTLDLSSNSLTGKIPEGVAKSRKLYKLNLSFNSLSGAIPVSLKQSNSLAYLQLHNNNLTGSIPKEIGTLSKLQVLDLSENDLTSDIPISLADLPKLSSFNVSYNNLSGSVPFFLSNKFNSSSFVGNLQLCGFTGSSPCPSLPPSQVLPSSPATEIPKNNSRKLSIKTMLLIASGALLGVLIILCIIWICCMLRKRRNASKEKNGGNVRKVTTAAATGGEKGVAVSGTEVEAGSDMGGKLVHFEGPLVFTADDLLCATAEIMGKSNYGTVYKATLEDGSHVAVKRLREKIAKNLKEFEGEVNGLGKIRHPNLLSLRAYYMGPKGEKLLVFDFMPKGSLASFLHARGPETPIDWPTRLSVAIGTARGLSYLHSNENIIHGNLTAANILLDEQTNAKIADYGLSRLMTTNSNASVVATAGAQGYRAPELAKVKNLTTKTDVYSLGVIMLELLTGKSPGEPMNGMDLPQWVASIVNEEWTNEVFDLELMKDANIGDELLNTLKLALHCVDPSPAARPEVHEVLQQLEKIKPELPVSSGEDGGD